MDTNKDKEDMNKDDKEEFMRVEAEKDSKSNTIKSYFMNNSNNREIDPSINKHVAQRSLSYGHDQPIRKENYQIAICQDGKFVVTFDTANLRIRVLENTDHRPFIKEKDDEYDKMSDDTENNIEDIFQQNHDKFDIYLEDDKHHQFNKKNNDINSTDEIDKVIAYFQINAISLDIDQLYETNCAPKSSKTSKPFKSSKSSDGVDKTKNEEEKPPKWSCVMSNIQNIKYQPSQSSGLSDDYSIFVAISRINFRDRDEKNRLTKKECDMNQDVQKIVINKDESIEMDEPSKPDKKNLTKTAIYCLRLKQDGTEGDYKLDHVTSYNSGTAGICRFVTPENVEREGEREKEPGLKFVILNYYKIYHYDYNYNLHDFELNNNIKCPESIQQQIFSYMNPAECMDMYLTYLYNQYFLVEEYENHVKTLKVYDLADMKLKNTIKRFEKKVEYINRNSFSINRLQLCLTNLNSIRLYLTENGLEIMSKKFKHIEKIHLIEFFDSDEKILIIGKDKQKKLKLKILDLYNTKKVINKPTLDDFLTLEDLDARLASTLGNVLMVEDSGRVISVLKKFEIELEQKKQNRSGLKPYGEPKKQDKSHNVYFHEVHSPFNPIVDKVEPWVFDDKNQAKYGRNSYCLKSTEEETIQLIVGRSTVQIWHQIHEKSKEISKEKSKNMEEGTLPNDGEPFLEYIWVNDIPEYEEMEETRLWIDDMKHDYESNDFCLKVHWYERNTKSNEAIKKKIKNIINTSNIIEEYMRKFRNKCEVETIKEDAIEEEREEIQKIGKEEQQKETIIVKREKTIQWKCITEAIAVRHACKALKHLNKRKKGIRNNYKKVYKYEEMVAYIKHIIWSFVKKYPDHFTLLDIRYNVMKDLILGDCDYLIKFILFRNNYIDENDNKEKGKEKEKKDTHLNMHIPMSNLWSEKQLLDLDYIFENYAYEEPKNILGLAIYHSQGRGLQDAIIVHYLLDYYSRHAEMDVGWMCTISSAFPLLFKYNYDEYIKKLLRKGCFGSQSSHSANDTHGMDYDMARSNNVTKFVAVSIKPPTKTLIKTDDDGKKKVGGLKDWRPHSVGTVPLSDFTANKILPKARKSRIIDALLFIFIPRWYIIGKYEKNRLSPFARTIIYENNDELYDNPSIEAVIDFRWKKARTFFYSLFIRFIIFSICFCIISWVVLDSEVNIKKELLVALYVLFYYLAFYLLVTEIMQIYYRGFREYFGDMFNWFDLLSIIIPVIVMIEMNRSSNFFRDNYDNNYLVVGVSIATFLLWVEAILYLRLFPTLAIHIYRPIIIINTVYHLFLLFIFVVIAFGHAMFLLVRYSTNLPTKSASFSGNVTNPTTNEQLKVHIQADFNAEDRNDDPFSNFLTAIEAAYYSNWTLRDQFDFWVINVFTWIASVILILLLQNLLIAYMSGEFDRSESKTRQVILRFRANQVADFEALNDINFSDPEPEPKYINYIGQNKYFEEWHEDMEQRSKGNDGVKYQEEIKKELGKSTNYDKYSILKDKDNHIE